MKIELNKHEIEFAIESWEGHIKNNTSCGDCKIMAQKCPVNNFFKKIKKQLKQKRKR